MKKIILLAVIASINLTSFAQLTPAGATPTAEELDVIFNKMMAAIKNVKTAKFTFIKNERYNGKIVESKQTCSLQESPRKIYMHILEGPNSGTETLYVEGKNDNDAYASAGKWIPTVSINPWGSLAMTKQRHSMLQLGFSYTGDLINHAYVTYKDKAAEYSNYGGIIKFNNVDVYKITLNNKEYKIVDYKVLAGENLIKIARKLKLDEYNLLEINPDVDDYDDVKVGQVIKVPTTFAKNVLMYVDTKTFLPVYQKMSDPTGVVGEYSYLDVEINGALKAGEFTKDFDGYGF